MVPEKPAAEPTTEQCPPAVPEEVLEAHAPAVFAVCLAHTRNHHDAEDLTQAVLLKTLPRISEVREPSRLRAWLFQVARRMCVDFHRRKRRMEPLHEEPPDPPSSDARRGERLHAAIQKLPADYREVIVLFYLDGCRCASVAASLGISEAAVRQRLVRARVMLHDLLQEEAP